MNRLKQLKDNNRGWGLLELLVVFSILTVITSVASFSLSLTPSTQAKELLYSLDSMISRTKSGSITKAGDVYMKVSNNGNNIVIEYYEDGLENPKEKNLLGDKNRVKLYYKMKDLTTGTETDYFEVTSSQPIYFAFDRRTTGFLSLKASSEKDIWETVTTTNWLNGTNEYYCVDLMVTVGEKDKALVEYHIELGPVTGTHYKDLK